MTYAVSPEKLVPRQDPTAQLLVLTARVELDEREEKEARKLASQVDDWDWFVTTAAQKFSVTFANRHLNACAQDIVPEHALTRMQNLTMRSGMASLKVAAAQTRFHKACIVPTRARYAYMKGVALSKQFGRVIADRYSRDVDVLVSEKDLKRVVRAAIDGGYRIMMDHDPIHFATTERDINFASNHAEVVTLIGEDGVPIEVHRRLGKLGLRFDLERIFSEADRIELSGFQMNTIPKVLHFVYVCSHHSRHFWSRLHWLSDLDSMTKQLNGKREEIDQVADQIGIRPTIDAAFELQHLATHSNRWDFSSAQPAGGQQFLNACLTNLNGGLEIEEVLRSQLTLGDFMSAWQISPGHYNAFWKNTWFRRLRPTVSQYMKTKYPPALQWLYRVQNAFGLISNAANRLKQSGNSTDDRSDAAL